MNLFHVEKSVFKKAVELFERTEESFEEDVQTVKKWMQTQAHLPEVLDDKRIQNFLLLNKCSVEKTKQKIDMYYTIRELIPNIYVDCNPKFPTVKDHMDICYVVPHPKLLNEFNRVIFLKPKISNQQAPLTATKILLNLYEVRFNEDCMVGDIYIVDGKMNTLRDMMQLTLPTLKTIVTIYQRVFSMRLKAMHLINSPPYITNIMAILKLLMKQKLFDRVQMHSDDKILKELFSDDELPKDYGGKGPSLEELNDMLKTKFSEYRDRFDQLDEMKVDESLRPQKLNNDEILGFYGNFKKLSVD